VNCPRRFYKNSDFIGECFRKLGRWIVSCHAKDLRWITELNVHFQEIVPGRGQIDYRRYLAELNQLAADTPLMIEHLKTPEEYTEAATYIRSIAHETGIQLIT
jgi:sugar phosphate isomerase/epimerase